MKEGYKTLLKKWCDSEFSHPKAHAVYHYIKKGQVISDLIRHKIISVDDNNVLLTKWPETSDGSMPELFKILPKEKGKLDQGSALVCWEVELKKGDPDSKTWSDKSLQESWIAFEASHNTNNGFCYITGKEVTLAVNHPAKLRHSGDKAKLISYNDFYGFTFRGRFIEATQACQISYELTQKAHNSLRWLIARQGQRNGDQVIIIWAMSGKFVPEELLSSTYDLMNVSDLEVVEPDEDLKENDERDHGLDMGRAFADKLKRKMKGLRDDLGDYDNIIIMAIDSATPGRLGITYYQ
jgi:CRISPR-associated protein Csd1